MCRLGGITGYGSWICGGAYRSVNVLDSVRRLQRKMETHHFMWVGDILQGIVLKA